MSTDYVPSLLSRARERARAEGLAVELIEGDAEALPFPDASFDAVVSALGVMFAPDHERAAAELLGVCRPGGTVALANWTPDGFVGELFATTGGHVPPPGRAEAAAPVGGRTSRRSSAASTGSAGTARWPSRPTTSRSSPPRA